ncbi:ATPase, T2SS/T4P/T4SS family [Gorillibacterium sp. sgz5001074]|uniref:ATPase, T2SS/T4P/T4SS family n=1 Tax=Gorillibacterium sp. sgz5001074 TaxID=3446695 RepID=UPI003F665F37
MEERFSVLSFADRCRSEARVHAAGGEAETNSLEGASDWFRELVEAIRTELAAPRGRSEEERQAYTHLLNRAVIGYEGDRRRMLAIVQDLLAKKRIHRQPPASLRFAGLAEAVFAEILGWSVLESILERKDGLEEIQVVGERVYEVRGGVPIPSQQQFRSIQELERLQQNLVLFNKDTLNIRKRWVEVALLDGSRVTMTGFGYTSVPTLTIRFYATAVYELDRLSASEFGTLCPRMARLLRLLVRSCFNLVITGPTNSGKTTLIKSLIREMPDHERLITIESRYELMVKRDFPGKNVIEYETDEEDRKHDGAQAFKLALRQSPKRICHAEIRDRDANIYVRACTRGHDGSMTTLHASNLEDVPEAIADMCLMDERGMDPARLVRRIAEYVTHIGLEMALVNGRRILVRIGEYACADGTTVAVRDWVCYDYGSGRWRYPMSVSAKALERVARYAPDGLRELENWMGEWPHADPDL